MIAGTNPEKVKEGSSTSTSNHIDTEDTHQKGIEALKQQIKKLQDKLHKLEEKELLSPARPYVILYRIDQEKYLDHPVWTQGRTAITSRVPVRNFDMFLERNKHALFIVYRDFNQYQVPKNESTTNEPIHTEESICPVKKSLVRAIVGLLQNNWRYESLLSEFKRTKELKAPYLFMYHNRSSWKDILAGLSGSVQKYPGAIARYVLHNYGHEYAAADASFAQQKVSLNFVKYMFQPGDILVSQVNGQYRGHIATSWPGTSKKARESSTAGETTESEVSSDDEMMTVPKPDQKSETQALPQLVQETGTSDSATILLIDTWEWKFDGDFKRQRSLVILYLRQKSTEISIDDAEWKFHDLNIYPLRLAPKSVIHLLEYRGRMFWKCRKRCLVAYQEQGKEIHEVSFINE